MYKSYVEVRDLEKQLIQAAQFSIDYNLDPTRLNEFMDPITLGAGAAAAHYLPKVAGGIKKWWNSLGNDNQKSPNFDFLHQQDQDRLPPPPPGAAPPTPTLQNRVGQLKQIVSTIAQEIGNDESNPDFSTALKQVMQGLANMQVASKSQQPPKPPVQAAQQNTPGKKLPPLMPPGYKAPAAAAPAPAPAPAAAPAAAPSPAAPSSGLRQPAQAIPQPRSTQGYNLAPPTPTAKPSSFGMTTPRGRPRKWKY